MKKIYMTPSVETIIISTVGMIAESLDMTNNNATTNSNGDYDDSRQYNDWD